jgi:hypothetical protein
MPWLPLSWLVLLAIPAGYGLVVAILFARLRLGRVVALSPLVLALVPALAITVRSSFIDPAARQEALAYVHTDAAYNEWFGYVTAAAQALGPRDVRIGVDSEVTWPLGWSLMRYRPHWKAHGDEDVIIAAESRAKAVERRLAGSYLRRTYPFREGAEPVVIYLRDQTVVPLLDEQTRATMTAVGSSQLVQASARPRSRR